jgi:hypothetical protein
MTESQLLRFERKVDELVSALNASREQPAQERPVSQIVREDQGAQWQRDISQIKDDVSSILASLAETE